MYSTRRYFIIFMALAGCQLYGMQGQITKTRSALLHKLTFAPLTIPSEKKIHPLAPSNGNDSEDEDIKITGSPYTLSTTPSIPNPIKK